MDIQNLIIPFKEFSSQVNSYNLKSDLAFIEKCVLGSPFKTWKSYLKNCYDLYSDMADFNSIASEIGSTKKGLPTFSGDIELILNRHLNFHAFNAKQNWYSKLKLTKPQREKIISFEIEILQLFFRLQLNHIKKDPHMLKTVNAFTKDFEMQQEQTLGSSLNPASYVDSLSMPLMNSMMENLVSDNEPDKNFYFADKSVYLKSIHVALVREGLIKEHRQFEKLFEKEYSPKNKLNPIVWTFKVPITQLMFLLYKLNKGKTSHNGYSLTKIAFDLFKFKSTTTENSLKVSFNQAHTRFKDRAYIERNMKTISKIIAEIGL